MPVVAVGVRAKQGGDYLADILKRRTATRRLPRLLRPPRWSTSRLLATAATCVAWPPPVARQRLGSDNGSAQSAVFLAGPRLDRSATRQDVHARLRTLPDVCHQRHELRGHSTFAMRFAARKRLFHDARNRAC